jgi:hypothetical protein
MHVSPTLHLVGLTSSRINRNQINYNITHYYAYTTATAVLLHFHCSIPSVLGDLDDDLSDVLLAFEILVRILRILELENLVHDWLPPANVDRTVQVIKPASQASVFVHTPMQVAEDALANGADQDSAQNGGLPKELARELCDVRGAGKEADDVDVSSHPYARHRLGDRARAADLNDMVHATSVGL